MILVPIVPILFAQFLAEVHQPPPKPELKPTVIALRPAPEPKPALKYRFALSRVEKTPGNAAIYYHRAIQMLLSKRNAETATARPVAGKPATESAEMKISNWIMGPIKDIPLAEARTLLAQYQQVLRETELGSKCKMCDWEFDPRTEAFELLLPEIQEMRAISRLVALKTKVAILDKDVDRAMQWVEIGLTVSQHTGDGPIIIQALVGIATSAISLRSIEDLIQVEGCPSLYWAFLNRARPFIDMSGAFDGERLALDKELPSLKELETGPWSTDRAHRFIAELQEKLAVLTETRVLASGPAAGGRGVSLPDITGRLAMAALVAKVYPKAKQALIAEGMDKATVETMPTVQVSVLYTVKAYYIMRDNVFKYSRLPYAKKSALLDRQDESITAAIGDKLDNPLLTLFAMLFPALRSAQTAEARLERGFDAIQCIEAIRMYAFERKGALPESLDAITDTPVPLDPATGKPFEYTRTAEGAVLSAPAPPGWPDHPSSRVLYELKLVK